MTSWVQAVISRLTLARGPRAAAFVGTMLILAGCHGLLDVSDPTLVQNKDIANASGADARRLDVLVHFGPFAITSAMDVALITDERIVDLPVIFKDPTYYLDRRDSEGYEALYATTQSSDPHLGGWDDIVTRTSIAIPQIHAYAPDSTRGDALAELFAIRGYAILQIAEDICPGFPINDVVGGLPVYSMPFTTDSAVRLAMRQLDSAIAYAHDSTDILNFARVARGRALLDLGQYPQAAAAVSDVPDDFVRKDSTAVGYAANRFYQLPSNWNAANHFQIRLAVGDTEGTNGLPFVSAHDPRVPTVYRLVRVTNAHDSLYDQLKYPNFNTSMVLSSGIEARLIEAEADLNAGDPAWFAILNTLRATMIEPAMAAIPVMPSATADQVDLLYRERAFWMYLTGRRLGDLRRLMRNYGRGPETVFPSGPYAMRGGNYGSATAIPFVQSVEGRYNSHITTGCTTR